MLNLILGIIIGVLIARPPYIPSWRDDLKEKP